MARNFPNTAEGDAFLRGVLATPPVFVFCHADPVTPPMRDGLNVVDSTLRHLRSYEDAKLEVFRNARLARALLVASNLDTILTHRLLLDSSQKRVVCAIAFAVVRRADGRAVYGEEFNRLMLAPAAKGAALEDCVMQMLVAEAVKMTDQIGIFDVAGPRDYLWLLDVDKKLSDKPRNIQFVKGRTTAADEQRAFMAVTYGLSSGETKKFLKNAADPDIRTKMLAASLSLAAGIFPEPVQLSEPCKKPWPSWLERLRGR